MSQLILLSSILPSQRREIATLIRRLTAREHDLGVIQRANKDVSIWSEQSLDAFKAAKFAFDIAVEHVKNWLKANAKGHLVFCDGRCWFVCQDHLLGIHADRAVDVSDEPREGRDG